MAENTDTRCECGAELPHHLAEVLTAHVCGCERRYKLVDGQFIRDGYEANPFAAYDRAAARGRGERRT